MFVVHSLPVAILFCVITMLGWGSWANTQKLAGKEKWPFQLFYWDYAIGVFLFSLVLAPMMMFGCAYYPWSALEAFPILHIAVLVNPLVYASEGLRGALVPQVPHMNTVMVIGALALIDLGLLFLGLRKFHQKAVS